MELLLGGLCWHWSRCGRQSLVLGPEDSRDKARNSRLFPGTRQQQTCGSVHQGPARPLHRRHGESRRPGPSPGRRAAGFLGRRWAKEARAAGQAGLWSTAGVGL